LLQKSEDSLELTLNNNSRCLAACHLNQLSILLSNCALLALYFAVSDGKHIHQSNPAFFDLQTLHKALIVCYQWWCHPCAKQQRPNISYDVIIMLNIAPRKYISCPTILCTVWYWLSTIVCPSVTLCVYNWELEFRIWV